MTVNSDKELQRVLEQLRQRPGLVQQLPEQERAVVRAALEGEDVHTIATKLRLDEAAVWRILNDAMRWASGQSRPRAPEQAGLGSTTEPGIHGGYADTAFGSLGNDPPTPTPEEPKE